MESTDVVALVLARGLGSRMRQVQQAAQLSAEQETAAAAGQKGMMPIVDASARARPFLDFVLSELADAGFVDVALVVAPRTQPVDPLRGYYEGVGRPSRLRLAFVEQRDPRGTADAVASAASYVGGRPFVVLNADNLYGVQTLRTLRNAGGPALPVYERDQLVESSAIPPDRVASFALLTTHADGTLASIIEKPGAAVMAAAGSRALVSMNCWRGDAQLMDACRDVERSPRGEFELPVAVQLAINRGAAFACLPALGPVLDLSRREDVGAVMTRLSSVEPRP